MTTATLCAALAAQGEFAFETAKVESRAGDGVVLTDRGEIRAPLIVDALGWRRVLGTGDNIQPPDALLSRGLEVHPHGSGRDLEVWIHRGYVPAGYGWRFPADGELRIGIGSFDPRFHVREPTVQLAHDLDAETVRYQGNWIPHALRPATEDGVFFVGDSAGHCLPLTAEGIRTALYFGIACGRELRRVVGGEQTREQALARYHEFSASHATPFPMDAARPAAGSPDRAAGAGAGAARDGCQAIRRLVVWPLPRNRASGFRRRGRPAPACSRPRGRIAAVRRRITLRQAVKWLALGVAIVLTAILALGNNVGSSQTLGRAALEDHVAASQTVGRTAQCHAGLGLQADVRSRPLRVHQEEGKPCNTASDAGARSHSQSRRH